MGAEGAAESREPAIRPPGYPARYEREVRLHDGRAVRIRPILPGDGPALAEAIRTADPETIRGRFLGGRPPVTPELVRHLTVVDYQARFALVAIDPVSGGGVGIARFETVADDDGVAEVAVAVGSAWRHAGLGTELLRLLAEAAAERGVRTFTGRYWAENRPVAALIEDAGAHARQIFNHGVAEFVVSVGNQADSAIANRKEDAAEARDGTAPTD